MKPGVRFYAKLARVINFVGHPIKMMALHNSKRTRVIICTDESILLQRTSVGSQQWNLPGGGIKSGESAVAAAIREVAEEVGITLLPAQLREVGSYMKRRYGELIRYKLIFLVVEIDTEVNPNISRPLEILEAKWFKKTNLPNNLSKTVVIGLNKLTRHP